MASLTFSQLEQLWEQAGGSPSLAPYAAATAIIESSGDPDARNPSGATGLWQLIPSNQSLIPGGSANATNPLDNAIGAVKLSGNTLAGLVSNWTQWETINGVPATQASVLALASSLGGGGAPPASPSSSAPATPAAASAPKGSSITEPSFLAGADTLLTDVATVLDYAFGMFGRGQGWRLVFSLVAIGAAIMAYLSLAAGGTVPSLRAPVVA